MEQCFGFPTFVAVVNKDLLYDMQIYQQFVSGFILMLNRKPFKNLEIRTHTFQLSVAYDAKVIATLCVCTML